MKNVLETLDLQTVSLKNKVITFFTLQSLIAFLVVLDDAKTSCEFGSLIYSKVEKDISAKSNQKGSIFKVAYAPIQTATSYLQKIINKQKLVIAELAKKGVIKEFKNPELKKTFWSKRHKNSILGIFDKTNEIKYLAYFPNGKVYNKKYFNSLTSQLIAENEIDYIPSHFTKYGSSTQSDIGIEIAEQVTPQILKLENLREVTINGYRIKFRPEQRY